MPALTVLAPGHTRNLHLVGVDRNDVKLCAIHEKVKLAPSRFTAPRFQDNTCLKSVYGGNEPRFGLGYQLQELLSLWLG